jgi:hypothetical protein
MRERHRNELGEFFAFVECDVIVCDSEEGWLAPMVRLMQKDPQLWMLGSAIDKTDFVDPEFAKTVDPELSGQEREFLIKAHSPKRQPAQRSKELAEPHNPPMRLLLPRTELLKRVVIRSDYEIYLEVKRLGYKAKIATKVVRRHLSLPNLFDYPGMTRRTGGLGDAAPEQHGADTDLSGPACRRSRCRNSPSKNIATADKNDGGGMRTRARIVILAAVAVCSVEAFGAEPGSGAGGVAVPLPAWWKLSLEIRGRAETYQGLGGIAGQGDSEYLHRLRLSSTFTVRPWLHVFAQMQDSRAPGYDRGPAPGSVADPFDLRLAYVELGALGEQPWALRAGRQPLVFGDMRLVSTSNWSNVGPAFDAVRVTHKSTRMRLDWFASLAVVPGEGFDRPRTDKKLAGFYSSFDLRKDTASVDLYSFWKSNLRAVDELGQSGHLNVFTYGLRSVGRAGGGFDYNVEVAVQRGRIVETPLAAWAGHWEVGCTLRGGRKAPRVWIEYNYATGDNDPRDGRRQTFEQLYPSQLGVVGRAADFASRNLHEPLAGIEWRPFQRWRFRGTYRAFWLATTQDALYTLSGAVFVYKPDAAHTRVGEEAGIWAICQASRRLQLWLGYANLTPGPYLRETGRSSALRYPYVMWTYNAL